MEKKVFIALLAIAALLSIAIALTLKSVPQTRVEAQGTTNTASKLRGLSVWQVGSSNALLDALLSELEAQGNTIVRSADLKDLSANVATLKGVLIVFSGDWLASASNSSELQVALQRVREQCESCAFVAVGGKTSSLFDVLDGAGIYRLARINGVVRNPAHDNPLAAGITWKIATKPTGETYTVPSIYACGLINPSERAPGVIAGALASWLGG